MRAGLIGATGLVGKSLLNQLLAADDCEMLRVWARRPCLSETDKLDWQQPDFEQLATQADCSGLDVVFCCLGTTKAKAGKDGLEKVDHDYVLALAQAARAAGVRQFCVISALGASTRSPAHYSRVKGQMEAGLRTLNFEQLDILRPSLLLGERSETRPGEDLGQRMAPALNALLPGPLKRYRAISGDDVAAAMLQLGRRPAPGQHIHYLPLAS